MKSPAADPTLTAPHQLSAHLDALEAAIYNATSDQAVRDLVQDLRVTADLWAEARVAAILAAAGRPPTDYGIARDAWVWVLAALIGLGAGAMGYVVVAAFRGG
jgi:hypothetical protein